MADEFNNQEIDFSSSELEETMKKVQNIVQHTNKGVTVNLTPLDIRKNEFKKSLRGYDVEEVTAFLEMVSMEYENLIRDNAMISEKLNTLTDQLKRYRDMEGTLQETLISAERTREDTLKNAVKQAELIVREAEVNSVTMIEDARRELSRLKSQINDLKTQKESYVSRLKALIKSQLETFEIISFPEENTLENIGDYIVPEESGRKSRGAKPPKISLGSDEENE